MILVERFPCVITVEKKRQEIHSFSFKEKDFSYIYNISVFYLAVKDMYIQYQ